MEQIISQIKSLKSIDGKIPNEWKDVSSKLFRNYLNNSNDVNLIISIISFSSLLDHQSALEVLSSCYNNGIGKYHSLIYVSLGLTYESLNNFISALDNYETGKNIGAEPLVFLEMKYKEFKSRMIQRFEQNSFYLGTLDNNDYYFDNGVVICKNLDSNKIINPKYNIINLVGYNINMISQSPLHSLNTSNISNKNERYQPGYDPSLLLSEDGTERSFEEARLQAIGIDFVSQRAQKEIIDKSMLNEQFSQEEVSLPKKKRAPLQEISRTETEFQDTFDLTNQPIKSILKKKEQTPKQNTSFGVTFDKKLVEDSNRKKRVPTPTIKKSLSVGDRVMFNNSHFDIVKQIGKSSFLCQGNGTYFVLKQNPFDLQQFQPNFPYLFILNIPQIKEYYVTEYYKYGTFQLVLDYFHNKPRGIDETTALFYLYQFLLIVKDLENHWLSHGSISSETLINKIPTKELPKLFNDEPIWKEEGVSLCRCDKLSSKQDNVDRESIASLYHFLCTKTELNGTPLSCPKRWNQEIWTQTFNLLSTQQDITPLISLISNELKQSSRGLQLRSSLSRINVSIMEK